MRIKNLIPVSWTSVFYKWDRTNYDALLNYNKNFGKHNIKGLLGWHTEKYNYKYQKAVRKKFPNNELTDMNAGDASTQSNEGYTAELAMISWFARINYDFAGKYLLKPTFVRTPLPVLRKVTVGDIFLLSRCMAHQRGSIYGKCKRQLVVRTENSSFLGAAG